MKHAMLQVVVRIATLGAVTLFGVAVVLGHLVPESDSALDRVAARSRPAPISRKADPHNGPGCRLLDPETGRVASVSLSADEVLDHASASPWRDANGNWQVVGCWTQRSGGPTKNRVLEQMGLARLTYPEGQVLDRVETDVVPVGPPCWAPGTAARVYFPAMNGRIYTYDFESGKAPGSRPAGPVLVRWAVPDLDADGVRISEVCWPSDPRFSRRLLVTLNDRWGEVSTGFSPPELWWLEMDDAGRTVIAAGRLVTVPDPRPTSRIRSPSVVSVPGAPCRLAYLSTDDDPQEWRLNLVELEFAPGGGVPLLRPGISSVDLGRGIAPDPPAFTADGRYVLCLLLSPEGRTRIVRNLVARPGASVTGAGTPGLRVL